jgi:hypothetical protein
MALEREGENLLDGFPARFRKKQMEDPTVLRVSLAFDEALLFEQVDIAQSRPQGGTDSWMMRPTVLNASRVRQIDCEKNMFVPSSRGSPKIFK